VTNQVLLQQIAWTVRLIEEKVE